MSVLSDRYRREVENQLNLLNLQNRPLDTIPKKPPSYVKQLYRKLDKREEKDQPSLVRCYLGHGEIVVQVQYRCQGALCHGFTVSLSPGLPPPVYRPESSRFFFNTTAEGRVPRNNIRKAELRLKLQHSGRRRDKVGSRVEVWIEEVRKPETKRRGAKLKVLNRTTISTAMIKHGYYLPVDITHLAQTHLSRPRKNLEIYVTVRGTSGRPDTKVPSLQLIDDDPDTKPLFVVYLYSEDERRRQDRKKRLEEKAKDAVDDITAPVEEKETTRTRRKRGGNTYADGITFQRRTFCSMKKLTINFQALNWSFIIAPDRFEANWCSGECPRTLTNGFNPTIHAILQSLFHWHVDKDVAQPCCVPDKLSTVNVLYYDQSDVITYKSYHGMRATSCGCH